MNFCWYFFFSLSLWGVCEDENRVFCVNESIFLLWNDEKENAVLCQVSPSPCI